MDELAPCEVLNMKLTVQYDVLTPDQFRYFCIDPLQCANQASAYDNYVCELNDATNNCQYPDLLIYQIRNQYGMCVQVETCLMSGNEAWT